MSAKVRENHLAAFGVSMRDIPYDLKNPSEGMLKRERIIREQSRKHYIPWVRQQVMEWLNKRYPCQFIDREAKDEEVEFSDPI